MLCEERNGSAGPADGDPLLANPPDRTDEKGYCWAGRCLRMWPIKPARDDQLWETVGQFIFNALKVEVGDVTENDIETIRQLKNPSKSRICDEVLVVFTDVAVRDTVVRSAPNLAKAG